MKIEFVVHGQAKTAGSKRAIPLRRRDGSLVMRPNGSPVVNVVDDCKESRDWKYVVSWAARQAVPHRFELLDGPLSVTIRFVKVRKKNQYRTGRNSHLLRDDSPAYPTAKPDVLKLARAVEDALTGVIWRDDSQIVSEVLEKVWGDSERIEVSICTMDGER